MEKHYVPFTQGVWLVLLWLVLLSQITWAQPVPDSQFARLGTTLAITTDGGFVTTIMVARGMAGGAALVKYSVQGDELRRTPLDGFTPLSGRLGLDVTPIKDVFFMAPATDGGTVLVGSEFGTGYIALAKVNATGRQVFAKLVNRSDFYQTPNAFGTQVLFDDLISTSDGGSLLLVTSAAPAAKTITFIRKYDPDGNTIWTKQVSFPTPNPATPDRSLTKGEAVINTPDGGYLIAGLYIPEYDNTIGSLDDLLRQSLERNTAWVAKLDGQGNVSWQKLLDNLPIALNPNDVVYPLSVDRMLTATDVTLAADGNGYALVGAGVSPNPRGVYTTGGVILELNADGNFKRARSTRGSSTESFITRYSGSGGRTYYAVGSTSQSSVNPEISLINPANLPLTSPTLLNVDARRVFDGPDDGRLVAIGVAGDGGLVFASSGNQVVKLAPETTSPPPPPGTLTLIQPTYNCQSGAITFNTIGGDGSPITYNAPGIMRSSATSNTGTVEQGLRNDPKPITITATQNGHTVSYTFDFGTFCSGTQPPVNPPVNPPIGGTLVLTQPTYNCQTGAITFNTSGGDGSPITYNAPGISRSSATSNSGTVEPGLRNDPKPITITATQNGQTVSYTFDFGAFCSGAQPPVNPPTPPIPPTGDALALLAPAYDCATGALTFRTNGGNGSPIEYMAPGITGWTTNPNQFVDRDSRTANDVKPFTLMARQNGVVVSYVWDLKAACGRSAARLGAGERVSELSVSVLGNPVRDAVTVEIQGAENQPLTLRLLDMRGRLVESRLVERAGAAEQQIFDVAQQVPGLLLLRAISGTRSKTVKILKQ